VAGSEKAAAHHLGLAHSTVKHHLANARSKVGVATTAQLVWVLAPRLPEPEACANGTSGRLLDAVVDGPQVLPAQVLMVRLRSRPRRPKSRSARGLWDTSPLPDIYGPWWVN